MIKSKVIDGKGIDAKWLLIGALLIGLLWQAGYLTTWLGLTTQPPGNVAPPPSNLWLQGGFNVGFTDTEENAFSGTTSAGTSPSFRLYHSNGRSLSSLSTLYGEAGTALNGATSVNFAPLKADNGIVFVSINAGTDRIPSVSSLKAANPGYIDSKWMDVDTQNLPRLVMAFDCKVYGYPNLNINPALAVPIHIRNVAETDTPVIDAPADLTATGTTSGTTKTIQWTVTGPAADAGQAVSQLYFTSNQTTAYIELQDITFSRNLPQKLSDSYGSSISNIAAPIAAYKTTSGVTQTWQFIDSKSYLANCYLFPNPNTGATGYQVTARFKCYFTAGGSAQHVTLVVSIKAMDADGTEQAVVVDTVTIGS